MKTGVLQFFSWPNRRVDLATVYARALERIEMMDKTGYDAVWLAEHHFTTFSVCPSVHMMGMLAAARTRRLRIGTAVSLAAFYHPLRLAEEVALLDVLSGGRVNWGAGRGFDRTEFENFGVAPEESVARFRETVEIVLRAWTEDRLEFSGQHFRYADVEVLPKPLQKPHPPTWLATTSDPSVEWAAEQGFSILMDPHSSHAEIARKQRLYAERLAAAGHRMEGRDIPVARLLAVARTRAEAEAVAERGVRWIIDSYADVRHRPVLPFGNLGLDTGGDRVARYLSDIAIHGTPDSVVDQIERLRGEMNFEYLLCAPLSQETFTLFTESVLPRLLAW
jgi:alkanesulfonate monooxygenase SsuD/methylene tetrahydromethanopterin reductase-like flavin-dependent oxidoreductase (luciferase family)